MQDYLNCAMDIGEQLLINGAEVHRVEDTIKRLCKAFGFFRTDVFIITSSMVVTVHDDKGSQTQTRRIIATGTNIEKLHQLNDLSRRICSSSMTLDAIQKEFNCITSLKRYPFWTECVAYAVIAAAFTLFFGGDFLESIVSGVISFLIRLVIFFEEKASLNLIFIKFSCCFFATLLSSFLMKAGVVHAVDKIIVGNIMTLIPGIGLTNSLRDLFTGDNIAGLLRLIESVLTALAIAAGYFVAVFLLRGVL